MSMNPVPRKVDDESQRLIDEYLAKGGNVTKCDRNTRSEGVEFKGGFYAKRKKQKEDTDE